METDIAKLFNNKNQIEQKLKKIIIKEISLINKIDKNKLLDSRIERYDKMGIFSESQ